METLAVCRGINSIAAEMMAVCRGTNSIAAETLAVCRGTNSIAAETLAACRDTNSIAAKTLAYIWIFTNSMAGEALVTVDVGWSLRGDPVSLLGAVLALDC